MKCLTGGEEIGDRGLKSDESAIFGSLGKPELEVKSEEERRGCSSRGKAVFINQAGGVMKHTRIRQNGVLGSVCKNGACQLRDEPA